MHKRLNVLRNNEKLLKKMLENHRNCPLVATFSYTIWTVDHVVKLKTDADRLILENL